jgi:hypothetical protein
MNKTIKKKGFFFLEKKVNGRRVSRYGWQQTCFSLLSAVLTDLASLLAFFVSKLWTLQIQYIVCLSHIGGVFCKLWIFMEFFH